MSKEKPGTALDELGLGNLSVGDVIEVDGLFDISDEKLLLMLTWKVGRKGGRERTLEFSVSYLGVWLGTATCKVIEDKNVWTWGKVQ
jgi:hypothetical protein